MNEGIGGGFELQRDMFAFDEWFHREDMSE